MDRTKLIERLMTTFLGELSDHVRALNDDLLSLEKDPGGAGAPERFTTLFRAAHSLKGASRSVGAVVIEEACHRLESILAAAGDGAIVLGPDLFALLFAAADAIEEAGMRLREQHELAGSPLALLLPRLEAAARGVVTLPSDDASPPPDPAATPTGRPVGVAAPVRGADEVERPTDAAAVVRIAAEKLDTMLAKSGELLVARRRFEARSGDLAELREALALWVEEWRGAARRFHNHATRNGEPRGEVPPPRRAVAAFLTAEAHLSRLEKDLEALAGKLDADRRHLDRAAGLLDEEVRGVRMLPFAEACEGLERIVRDVAMVLGKEVALVVEGGAVELDRAVLEQLKAPLVHLVRNAVDHGIEAPGARVAAGKPAAARVLVSAALRGPLVEIVVADDGAGLDSLALQQAARQRGIAAPAAEGDLAELIFLPGFSTAPLITNISGRGVGLDVVKSRLEALHGTIEVATVPTAGTRFTLTVPLTLTTMRALLVRAGGQVVALPGASVQRLVRVALSDVRTIEGRGVLTLGGPPVPVASLAEVLGLAGKDEAPEGRIPALVLASGPHRVAFLVGELIAEQEIIVKSLGARIRRVRQVSGATILASGQVALVLNVSALVRAGLGRGKAPFSFSAAAATAPVPARPRLLVVDDSVTTRTLEKTILESAGYVVATAVDGEAGWRLLQEQGADLVISDVEMPRMDGFALTLAVRASPRFATVPVILFTSMASERDRARGIEVGADAYIVKGAFDQKDLLETIAQLL